MFSIQINLYAKIRQFNENANANSTKLTEIKRNFRQQHII